MKLCSIASGSSGNCIYIASEQTAFLIDAGISKRRIVQGLKELEVDPADLDGIFITHEHLDHIRGLGAFVRQYHVPIYATQKTKEALLCSKYMGQISQEQIQIIQSDVLFSQKDMQIMPFSISHDASDPVCYTFYSQGSKIGIATDLGTYNEYTIEHLKNADALLLEANYDPKMLEVGPYPYQLKRRILGHRGHLSNESSGKLLVHLWNKKLRHIFLGHLSKENNYPQLAYETVKVELQQLDESLLQQVQLHIAKREERSECIYI